MAEEESAPPGFPMPMPLLPPPPPPAEWAAGGNPAEEEAFQEYDEEEEYDDDEDYDEAEEYEAEEHPAAAAASTSEGGRVLIVQRPQAAASGPATPPLNYDQQPPPNYKTLLCRHYQAGSCSHGNRCTYAHGEHELRRPERPQGQYQKQGPGQPARHPGEKTVVCRFWQNGYCKHGPRCTFLHGYPEQRQQYSQPQGQQYQQQRPAVPPPPRVLARPGQAPQEEAGQELMAVDPQELVSLLQGTHLDHPNGHAGGQAPAPPPSYSAAVAGRGGGGDASAASQAPPLSAEVRSVLQRRFRSLLCPVTLEPFVDPVVAADGNIYERRAIEDWLYRGAHDTSPLTNERLPHKMVMPCGTMRRCVDEVAQFVTAMRQQVL